MIFILKFFFCSKVACVTLVFKEGAVKKIVVVELKGCWNSGLHTQIETQLRQEYLINIGHRCGVYLVGWFGTDNCKGSNSSLVVLQRKLEAQASKLSKDDVILRTFVLDASIQATSKA